MRRYAGRCGEDGRHAFLSKETEQDAVQTTAEGGAM
jgi:hypothetical protein